MLQMQRTETFLIKHSLTCWQLQTHGQNTTILHITEWEKQTEIRESTLSECIYPTQLYF